MPKLKVGDGLEAGVEMGPLITREHRDKVAGYVEGGAEEGATLVVDGRETAPGKRRLLPRPCLFDNVTPTWRLQGRDLRPGARRHARRDLRRGDQAREREPVRERRRDLHERRRRGPQVPARGRGRHGRHQRADSGADGLLLVRRLEGVAVRRHAHLRAATASLLHAHQGRDLALAGSGHVEVDLGFPQTR